MKSLAFICAIVALVLAIAGWSSQSRPAWEYKSIVGQISSTPVTVTWREDGKQVATINPFAKATDLGSEGWELVSVTFNEDVYAYWFKRPKR